MTAAGTILGTIAYLSPEQAQGKPVDSRSDVFSLGTVLYEMATGSRPFTGDNNMSIVASILHDTPRPITDLRPDSPEALGEIVQTCLTKDVSGRFADAGQLSESLAQLQRNLTGSAVSGLHPLRRRWTLAAFLIAFLVVAITVTWTMRRRQKVEWARTVAIPEIQTLGETGKGVYFSLWGLDAWKAHTLAASASRYIGDDPFLVDAWDMVTGGVKFKSDPPGADVWAKPYLDPNGAWQHIGRTPVGPVRFPLGLSRVKFELSGYRTEYRL